MILGIDTSAVVCTAALAENGKVLRRFSVLGKTHSEILLPGILELLKKEKRKISDLSAIAFSAGPGSFTGLRIGIATVKGLAVKDRIPCVPLSTLEALAWRFQKEAENAVLCPVMDARRGEFYQAFFRLKSGSVERLTEDRAVSGEKLTEEISGLENVILLGDGAEKYFNAFSPAASLAPEEKRLQDGGAAALLGEAYYEKEKYVMCESLTVQYLRLPQAEREWLEKQKEISEEKGELK